MTLIVLYAIAVAACLVGTASIYLALIPVFPVAWLYHHYRWRRTCVWSLTAAFALVAALDWSAARPDILVPLLLLVLGIVLTYRMHQEAVFDAVDFPAMAADPLSLPLEDLAELAIIDWEGVVKAYPLDYVIHHHIINDRFGDRLAALTYCAMCRTVLAFDVTELGPLFVGSFKRANMIVADRRTHTFFQQGTFESIIGALHPSQLILLPAQQLTWAEIKQLTPIPQVAAVRADDLREFELPIPGLWRRILASEATPGLRARERDGSLPARTRVVGTLAGDSSEVFLKDELLRNGLTHTTAGVLVASRHTVNGFRATVGATPLNLALSEDRRLLIDESTQSIWDLLGRPRAGPLDAPLERLVVSDEYWFSWRLFHPNIPLRRIEP